MTGVSAQLLLLLVALSAWPPWASDEALAETWVLAADDACTKGCTECHAECVLNAVQRRAGKMLATQQEITAVTDDSADFDAKLGTGQSITVEDGRRQPCSLGSTLEWAPQPGKCLAVNTAVKRQDGNRLYLWDCLEGVGHEQFILPTGGSQGQIRWAADPNQCMDVQDGDTANGAHLELWTCYDGNPNQQFLVSKDGLGPIRWATHPNRCLSVLGKAPGSGSSIGLWQCGNPTSQRDFLFLSSAPTHACGHRKDPRDACASFAARQKSSPPAEEATRAPAAVRPVEAGAPLRLSKLSSRCLTVGAEGTGGWGRAVVWDCDESQPGQRFLLPASGRGLLQLAARPDRCLQVADEGTGGGNGLPLLLRPCKEDSPSQQFAMADFAGPIRWIGEPGKCLSLLLGIECNGNDFVAWDCGEGDEPGFKFDILRASAAMPAALRGKHARADVLYTDSEASVRYRPEVGNGFVATVVGSDSLFAAGVFNGCMRDAQGRRCATSPSQRARIPAPLALRLAADPTGAALDLRSATYTRHYPGGLQLRFYAHRTRKALLVAELLAEAPGGRHEHASVEILGGGKDHPASDDFNWSSARRSLSGHEVIVWTGKAKESELAGVETARVAVVLPAHMRGTRALAGGSSMAFLAAVRTSLETSDPVEAALADWAAAVAVSPGELYAEHLAAWAQLWEAGIEVEGRADVARALNSSLYYILSSLRRDTPFSLSPGGLASNAYLGHTFWDTEMWMLPPMTLWHPELAGSLLEYRVQRLGQARAKARSYNKSYTGAMFPWESAVTGAEECPPWADTGRLEQHITADIAVAQEQFWLATRNRSQLEGAYQALVSETADFWVSRVRWQGQEAHIKHIVPPDEYATGDDSVFTNLAVKRNLEFATRAAADLGRRPDPRWAKTAAAIPILFNKTSGIHPEYDGYHGARIKQADVVLLGFPLLMHMSPDVRRADLDYYDVRTDANGPAMTWAMHAIGYMELGNAARSSQNFNRAFANAQQPFGVWSENPQGGAVNFITGAGGFLQAALYGLAGLRIRPDHLELNPSLVDGLTAVTLRGVHYHGSVLEISYRAEEMTVSCRAGPGVTVVTDAAGGPSRLPPGGRKTIARARAKLLPTV